jgi:demethylmenaquinone methyltransferase/2-methoxy-6-polyprenyl-1,4-benzoquinol methylase
MSEKADFGYREVERSAKAGMVASVFRSVARSYDVMNDLMSLGLHRLWKRFFIDTAELNPGERVLDLAGGTGDISLLAAEKVGRDGFVVLSDINEAMLAIGRDRVLDHGHFACIECLQIDAEALPFKDASFDLVTIAFGLRNVTDKSKALREMQRVLRVGGRALILEFSELKIDALKPVYDAYSFQVLPRLGKFIAGDAESYRYLAESIRKHPNQEALRALMLEAGLERVEVKNLLAGLVAIHRGYKL